MSLITLAAKGRRYGGTMRSARLLWPPPVLVGLVKVPEVLVDLPLLFRSKATMVGYSSSGSSRMSGAAWSARRSLSRPPRQTPTKTTKARRTNRAANSNINKWKKRVAVVLFGYESTKTPPPTFSTIAGRIRGIWGTNGSACE